MTAQPVSAITPIPSASEGVNAAAIRKMQAEEQARTAQGDSQASKVPAELQTARVPQDPKPNEGKAENQSRQEGSAQQAPQPFRDVRIQFKIDPDSHDVTVLMIDKESKRVIRSIPPQELRKLADGTLLQLLA
jgi:uncharacterized FlaG/YvyC family protein